MTTYSLLLVLVLSQNPEEYLVPPPPSPSQNLNQNQDLLQIPQYPKRDIQKPLKFDIPQSPTLNLDAPNDNSSIKDLKTWLLTHLIVELSFNETKIAEVEKRLNTLDEQQLRILIQVYKERVAKRDLFAAQKKQYIEQQILNQATLDLMTAQGYRDHLQREYHSSLLQKQMETNLIRQNIQNQNRFMNGGTGGYGNYGFGGMNGNRYYRGW